MHVMSSSSFKCQVAVRNLPKRTTAKQLQQYASRFGSIVDCYLTQEDGEALIEFNDRTSVDVFMDKRPHTLDGNELQCQRCLPTSELQKPVKRIFIRGTVQQLTDNRLSNYFDKYGKVLSCTIPKGKRNGFTHFGYAFVAFADEDAVDRIIQDKPHYIDDIELEVQKAEDLARGSGSGRRSGRSGRSTSRSPSTRSSRSSSSAHRGRSGAGAVNNNGKRVRRGTPSPPPPPPAQTMAISSSSASKRLRTNDDYALRQLEQDNRRLREHAVMVKQHYDEDMWKIRRDLDDERRRHDQLKVEFEHVRRELARATTELQQYTTSKSSRHVNGRGGSSTSASNRREPSSRH